MAQLIDANTLFYKEFEPKTQNRFVMTVGGIPSYLIRNVTRPTLTMDATTIDHINLRRKIKSGKAEWGDVTFTMYDPVVPSGAQSVMEWVRLAHESVTGRNGYADFYKKEVVIDVLGPVGDKVEQWTLKGAFPISVDFGPLDWATGDPAEITVTLAVDYCILQY